MGKHIILFVVLFGILVGFLFVDPITQNPAFHNFADQRTFFDIPNFMDFISNLPFLIVGIMGAVYTITRSQTLASRSWPFFFISVALVGIGSAYYHLDPTNETLVWDRIPMTLGFMALFTALLSEFINPKFDKYLLPFAVILGPLTVIYWHYFGDLRLYIWAQILPLITIPLVLVLYKNIYTKKMYFIYSLICYLLAKVTELMDSTIYYASAKTLSGHTIKHLLSALGIFFLYLMLIKRTKCTDS